LFGLTYKKLFEFGSNLNSSLLAESRGLTNTHTHTGNVAPDVDHTFARRNPHRILRQRLDIAAAPVVCSLISQPNDALSTLRV